MRPAPVLVPALLAVALACGSPSAETPATLTTPADPAAPVASAPVGPAPGAPSTSEALDPWAQGVGEGAFDRLEVLDATAGLVAFKVVSHFTEDEYGPEGANCGYAGMQDTPTSGVLLGVWDLAEGRATETWTVYAPARAAAQCTPEAESKRALDAAKARIAELGLDLARKPASIALPETGAATLVVGGAERAIEVASMTAGADHPVHDHVAEAILSAGGKPAFEARHFYTPAGADRFTVRFPFAVDAAGTLVIAVVAHQQPNRWADRVSFGRVAAP